MCEYKITQEAAHRIAVGLYRQIGGFLLREANPSDLKQFRDRHLYRYSSSKGGEKMRMLLKGFERVVPKGKDTFTMLYTQYPKVGVTGEKTEAIYVADGFPIPPLTVGMLVDVDRDGKGYLLEISAVEPQSVSKLNVK